MGRAASGFLLALLSTLALVGTGLAEDKPAEYTGDLEAIVVTASKTPKPQKNVTQEVSVITEDAIDHYIDSKKNVTELLTFEPGIFVNILSRNDANWGSVGGLAHKYNTYMLNGLPIDSFVDPQSLDPWAFQRIEIQRGPASILYPNYLFMDFAGNQTPLAGTINLILRSTVDSPMTKVSSDFGSYNTWTTRVYHQNRVGDLHFFLGGMYEQSDYTNYGTNPSWLNMIDDPEYEKIKLYGYGTYHFGGSPDHTLSFFAHHFWHDGDAGRPNRDFEHEYTTLNAQYNLPISSCVTAQAKAGYRNYDRAWMEDNYPKNLRKFSDNGVDQFIIPADFSIGVKHLEGGLLTVGTDFQYANYETFTDVRRQVMGNDAAAYQNGIYLQEEYTWRNWVFRGGGRWSYLKHEYDLIGGNEPDIREKSWNKFLWSAGARYNVLENLSLFTNAGSSFVAPGIMSIGGTLSEADAGVPGRNGRLPNPGLQPEEGMGFDLGVNYQITPSWYFAVRGFLNLINDQIVQIVVSQDPSQAKDINAGKTTAYGLEVELKHRWKPWMEAFANYTYTHSNVENDLIDDQNNVQVPFVPEHMGNFGLTFYLPYDFRPAVWVHVVGAITDSTSLSGRREFDPYAVLNMKIEKGVIKNDCLKLDAYLDLYNVTNEKYEMPWQFQDPGFAASGGLKIVF